MSRNYDLINQNMQEMADRKAYICDLLPHEGVGVEIGVFLGQFSKIILEKAKPKKLYLVDPWGFDTSFPDEIKKERRTREQMDEMARSVKKELGKKKNVKVCRQTSDNFFKSLPESTKFDFVYIDGNHNYDYVLRDLRNAWDRLQPGGVIIVDDYNTNIEFWGQLITNAVIDFCQEKGIQQEIHNHNQCVIKNKIAAFEEAEEEHVKV